MLLGLLLVRLRSWRVAMDRAISARLHLVPEICGRKRATMDMLSRRDAVRVNG